MFSRRAAANVRYCPSWKDLTTEEVARHSADKTRAVCHMNKGHHGDHGDKILGLAWAVGGWPRTQFYPLQHRANDKGDV
jgi:hypothetical protein